MVRENARIITEEDYATIKGFGSRNRTTTFYWCEDKNIRVSCGCFTGTIQEFRKKVKETHGENRLAQEYMAVADLMEAHLMEAHLIGT